jgi:cyanophycinase-like exopeptidase
VVGPVGLVGSGEFTPATEAVDTTLLDGRAGRVVYLPTAAAPEGATTIEYWVDLGRQHYRRLGVDASALMVLNRADADREDLAAQVEGAALVYLSGGNPTYLAATLVGTRVGEAIRDAWERGTAVAGCSAGAIALTETVPDIRNRRGDSVPGLNLVPGLSVIPHFDRIEQWMPGAIQLAVDRTPAGVHLIGIDEDTAVVGGPSSWRVMGRGAAWLLDTPGSPARYDPGSELSLT